MQKREEIRIYIHSWLYLHKKQKRYTRNIKVVTDRPEQHEEWEDGEWDGKRFFNIFLKINLHFEPCKYTLLYF